MIITQEHPKIVWDCKVEFGLYMQVNHKLNQANTMKAQILDAIYVRRAPDAQNGHQVMALILGCMITRRVVHPMLITQLVIENVSQKRIDQGNKELKFCKQNGVIYHDNDWITKMNYNNQDNEEDELSFEP